MVGGLLDASNRLAAVEEQNRELVRMLLDMRNVLTKITVQVQECPVTQEIE